MLFLGLTDYICGVLDENGAALARFMKRILSLTVIATLAMTGITGMVQSSNSPAKANGEFRSSFGTEFWVHWDSNFGTFAFIPRLFLAAAADSTVTITYPDGSSEQVVVAAGTVADVLADEIFNDDTHVTSTEIRDIGVKITATTPISVYQYTTMEGGASSEASLAYPSDFLGKRYRIVTPAAELTGNSNVRYSVLAVEPGTTLVDVIRPDGYTVQKTLLQGEVYTQRSKAVNLQGYLVVSDKRVAVMTGAPALKILDEGASDLIMESLAPTETWGKNYLVPKTQNTSRPDGLVVVADEDGTTVTINGSDVSLNAGENHYFTSGTTSGSVDVISADKKIAVMQIVRNGSYTNGDTTVTGDPAAVMMVPTEQFLNDFLISTPGPRFTVNQISIIAKTSDVGNVQLDGSAVGSQHFTAIAGTDYSAATVNISEGQHRISSDDGLQVYTYGYNDNDSFAYPGGTGLVDTILNPGGTADTGFRTLEQVISGASPYEISYSLNGGEGAVPPSTSGFGPQEITSVTPTRDGFIFVGWNTSADGTGTRLLAGESFEPSPAQDTQLFAEWVATHTVTFNPNYGSGISTKTQTIVTGQSTQLTESFDRSGYSFVEWATASDGSGATYALAEAVSISGDLTLYAQWSANSYTLTFDYDGATGGNSLTSIDYTTDGAPVTLPAPTKTGFVFDGWYSDAAKTLEITGPTHTISAGSTIYAKWVEAPIFTISYEYDDSDGGESRVSDTFTDGDPGISLPVPSKTGNAFDGWYETSDFSGSAVTSPYTTTVDITLYAKWIATVASGTPGPIITNIGEGNAGAPYETFGGETIRVDGQRLSGVTKVFLGSKEGTVVSTADDHFIMISPDGLAPGLYNLEIQSSLGNLTYQDGFVVTETSANVIAANEVCEGVETSWWTKRISETQAKAYIKCPEIGQKYRILHQTGGSGEYSSILAKTLTDKNDASQRFTEFGRYLVRTINLEDINRIRIRVDDEELWKVRYNKKAI